MRPFSSPLAVVWVSALFPLWSAPVSPSGAEDIRKAIALHFDGKIEEAREAFERGTTEGRDDLEFHVNRQNLELLLDREAVLAIYTKRAQERSDDPDALYLEARLHFKRGSSDRGKKALDRCLSLAPVHRRARDALILNYIVSGNLEEAHRLTEEILRDLPEDHAARMNAYLLALMRKDRVLAKRHLEAAERAAPDDPFANLRVIAAWFTVDPDAARTRLATLKEKHPRSPYLLNLEGKDLLLNGKLTDALAKLEEATSLVPREPDFHQTLAAIHGGMGRFDLAQKETETYRQLQGPEQGGSVRIARDGSVSTGSEAESAGAWQQGTLALQHGDIDKALALYRRAAEISSPDPDTRCRLAALYWRLGRADDARAILPDPSVLSSEAQVRVLWEEARWFYNAGHLDRAREALAKAIDLDFAPSQRTSAAMARRWEDPEPAPAKRLPLKRPPLPLRDSCVPGSLATLCAYWKVPYTGPVPAENRPAEGLPTSQITAALKSLSGLQARIIEASETVVKRLVDADIPLILMRHVRTEKGVVGHASPVAGYDDRLGCYLLRERSWGTEEWLYYEDARPALALVLFPEDRAAFVEKQGPNLADWLSRLGPDTDVSGIRSPFQDGALMQLCLTAGACAMAGKFEDALALLDILCAARPDHAPFQELRGTTLHLLGRYEEALEALERADTAESFSRTKLSMALAAFHAEKTDRCLEILNDKPNPNFEGDLFLDFHFLRGKAGAAQEKAGVFDESLSVLKRLSPDKARQLSAYREGITSGTQPLLFASAIQHAKRLRSEGELAALALDEALSVNQRLIAAAGLALKGQRKALPLAVDYVMELKRLDLEIAGGTLRPDGRFSTGEKTIDFARADPGESFSLDEGTCRIMPDGSARLLQRNGAETLLWSPREEIPFASHIARETVTCLRSALPPEVPAEINALKGWIETHVERLTWDAKEEKFLLTK